MSPSPLPTLSPSTLLPPQLPVLLQMPLHLSECNEEGNGKGGKRDGDGDKESKGKGGKSNGDGNKEGKDKGGKRDGDSNEDGE